MSGGRTASALTEPVAVLDTRWELHLDLAPCDHATLAMAHRARVRDGGAGPLAGRALRGGGELTEGGPHHLLDLAAAATGPTGDPARA